MRVRPISLNKARVWLAEVHRHLKRPVTGWLFGIEILDDDGKCIGVAMAGRPLARMLQDGLTCEITRVGVLEGHYNACSFAYGALRRAAVALGYTRIITYTREDEIGTSPQAAGFIRDGLAGGGEWSSPSRKRNPNEDTTKKVRWVWYAADRPK